MRAVIHAKSEPLALKADDAWTSWPDHLDPCAIVEPHFPQAMDHIARTQDTTDTPPLSCPEPTKGNQIGLSFFRYHLTRCLHAWVSHISECSLLLGQRCSQDSFGPRFESTLIETESQ
jgi:hypothetical protein